MLSLTVAVARWSLFWTAHVTSTCAQATIGEYVYTQVQVVDEDEHG